jgi:hypothetical protein
MKEIVAVAEDPKIDDQDMFFCGSP